MRRKVAERRKQSAWSEWRPRWLALLSSLPVITVILTLIGYGYDLAYLEAFGLSPQAVQHGPLDFLLRATYGLLPLVEKSNSLKELLSTTEGLARIWRDTEWMRYLGAVVALILLLLAIVSKEFASATPFESTRLTRAAHRSRQFAVKVTRALKCISRTWRFLIGFTAIGWLTPPVATWLLGTAIWIAGSLVLLALTAAPIMGITAGSTHARELVIEPTQCVQRSVDTQKTKDGAICVRVLRDGKEIARGRLIDQTSNRVWLFRKHPWSVVSVPLDGAVIEYTNSDSST